MKIVADDKIPYLRGVMDPFAEVTYLPGKKISRADLMDADALLTRTRTLCNEELLAGTKVKFIASATIGFDHIDTEYCRHHGISWTNAPGCNAMSVAQYMVSLLLSLAITRESTLKGKVLGIIGAGNVGKKVIHYGKLLGMEVLVNDPPRERAEGSDGFVSLKEIQKNADFITLHVPMIKTGPDKTFHLADADFLAGMKRNGVLINASRGSVTDNEALIRALTEKTIAGAALDVWEKEPDISRELLRLCTYATPHIAGYSADGKATGTRMSVEAIAKFFGWKGTVSYQSPEAPEQEIIQIGNSGSFEERLFDAVKCSYDIRKDDASLRKTPEEFESLRGNYPVRREFQAYKVSGNENFHEFGFEKLS